MVRRFVLVGRRDGRSEVGNVKPTTPETATERQDGRIARIGRIKA